MQNGLLSSLPYLGKYIFAVITSTVADYLRKSGKLSTTATRKVFTSAGTWEDLPLFEWLVAVKVSVSETVSLSLQQRWFPVP